MDVLLYEDFFTQLKTNFWLAGIPYGDSKIHLRFYMLIINLILIVVGEFGYFISRISAENLLELTSMGPCITVGILSLLKMISMCLNRHKIYDLIENLRQLYNQIIADRTKWELVKHDLNLVHTLLKYLFVLNVALTSVYNFATIALILYHYVSTKQMAFIVPYPLLLPFSTDSWIPWLVVYLDSVACGNVCVLFYTTVDALYFVLTSQVCANFCIISDAVAKLDETKVGNLSEIVKFHQLILKLADDLEEIFTAPNLVNVLIGSLEICALGFTITTGSWAELPGCIIFLISVIVQILMMSVFGENLIRDSMKIGDAAFLCSWLKMDMKSRKTILTIMIRAQKPQKLTAYKFSTICYASFTKIMSTSWSYFTILKTVYMLQSKLLTSQKYF